MLAAAAVVLTASVEQALPRHHPAAAAQGLQTQSQDHQLPVRAAAVVVVLTRAALAVLVAVALEAQVREPQEQQIPEGVAAVVASVKMVQRAGLVLSLFE